MKIRELFTEEKKWTKEVSSRNSFGEHVSPNDPSAVCWCLIGAAWRCNYNGIQRQNIYHQILLKLGEQTYKENKISLWNDAPERTFAEVKALVDELDI